MGIIRHRQQAEEDAVDIWCYLSTKSIEAADRFADRLDAVCITASHQPESGSPRPEFGETVRMLVIDNYVVLYKPLDEGIDVIRILDGRRDVDRIVLEGEPFG